MTNETTPTSPAPAPGQPHVMSEVEQGALNKALRKSVTFVEPAPGQSGKGVTAETVLQAMQAVCDASRESNRLFPQVADEVDRDFAAKERIAKLIRWHGDALDRIPGWPRLAEAPAQPVGLTETERANLIAERDQWHDAAIFAGNADSQYKRMFEDAVRALAEIDEVLGIEPDGCNDPQTTVSALKDLLANLLPNGAKLRDALAAQPVGMPQSGERKPDGYAYEYAASLGGGVVIRFNHGQEVNGGKPKRAIPYFFDTAPPTSGGDERRHVICLCPDCVATPTSKATEPLSGPELIGWVHEWGAITAEKGSPSRVTCKRLHDTEEEARHEMDATDFNGRVYPAFTAPPEPLTEQQVWESEEIMSVNGTHAGMTMATLMIFIRAVERAHGIEPHKAEGEAS